MKKMKMKKKRKKKENKRGKNNQIFGSIILQSSQPSVVLHSTIYANLVFSPRIPIFFSCCVFILGIVTGLTSRKALFSSSYKPSYFLSFGTDLLRDFYTFLLSTVYLTGKGGVSR